MATIIKATTQDVSSIQKIANETWHTVYLDMIGREQIEYMLGLFYKTDVLTEQITTRDQIYLLLVENDTPIAFASYGKIDSGYKLHKLYCLPSKLGNGYGKQLLIAVEQEVRELGCNNLELAVNRNNPAQRFYTREGYSIKEEIDLDIGNGFFMNDYIMTKTLI